MLDINGNEVRVGDKCKFYFELYGQWVIGTVRKVVTYNYRYSYQLMYSKTAWEAKVDNGDPLNFDVYENGCTMAARIVDSNRIEIIKEA